MQQENGKPNGSRQLQTALEPIIQEDVPFHDHTITAVRLEDGRIAVVLRWVCEILNMNPQAQVQRIERTSAIAGELVRVKVHPRQAGRSGGGRQIMPALTLRGFPAWILGMNPNEIADGDEPQRAEHIRQMITAYQLEAVDALYQHFAKKDRLALPVPAAESRAAVVVPAVPLKPEQEPGPEATNHERAAYHERMSVWHRHRADLHAHAWRDEVEGQLESLQIQRESEKAVTDLIPDILARLGPETISATQQGQVRGYAKRLHEASGKPYPTIYDDLRLAFGPARYQDLLAADWPQVEAWFFTQIERDRR